MSVQITRHHWAAAELTADQYPPMRDFFRDVLGLALVADYPDTAIFATPAGGLMELYGPQAPRTDWRNGATGSAFGFEVDDVEAARDGLLAAGVSPVEPTAAALEGLARVGINFEAGIYRMEHNVATGAAYRWLHFRAPDGRIYSLSQSGAATSAGGPRA